jgi:hypothetical protein
MREMSEIKVYIASPYSNGNQEVNVNRSILAGEMIASAGFYPYLPLLTHYWHMIAPHEIEFWYKMDLVWLKTCDAVLRLDGESKGADAEVEFAKANGIPVFFGISELYKHYGVEQ